MDESWTTYPPKPSYKSMRSEDTVEVPLAPSAATTESDVEEFYDSRAVLVAAVPVSEQHTDDIIAPAQPVYRLYKRRFVGLVAIIMLNIVTGMAGAWFGPISENASADFHISLDQVNWLSNVGGIVYVVFAPFIPFIYRTLGIRWACLASGVLTLVSSWLRALATINSLSSTGSFSLLILSQMLVSAANVLVEILGTKYSQTWFNTKGRTTATMAIAISNSIGTAIGSVLAPSAGSTRQSILVLAVIGTVGSATAPLVGNKPPTPPTYAALAVEENPPTVMETARALCGRERDTSKRTYMTFRQRIDFLIILAVGGVLSSVVDAFGTLSNQILAPYNYSDTVAGLSLTVLLVTGLVTAIVTAPLLDRVFMKHMGLVIKILCPVVGLGWLSLIWAIRPNNTVAILVVMGVIGAGSLTMLPVGLEMCVEVTRNAEGSAAILNMLIALEGVIFVQIESVMRAGPNAHPPYNLTAALILNGVLSCVVCFATLFIEGKQTRREQDEVMQAHVPPLQNTELEGVVLDRMPTQL